MATTRTMTKEDEQLVVIGVSRRREATVTASLRLPTPPRGPDEERRSRQVTDRWLSRHHWASFSTFTAISRTTTR